MYSYSGGYRTLPRGQESGGLPVYSYKSLDIPDTEKFPFANPDAVWQRSRLTSAQAKCRHNCQAGVDRIVLDPYWELVVIFGNYTGYHHGEVLDSFMLCNDLKDTLYKSEGIGIVCVCLRVL